MMLIPYDINKLNNGFKRTKLHALFEEFITLDVPCVKIDGFEYKNTKTGTTTINNSIKRFKYFNVKAITRNGEIFLIRLDKI